MKKLYSIILCVVLLAVTGCRSSKQTTSTTPTADGERSLSQHFETLAASYTDWEDVNIPVRLELESPKKMSISGRATMVRDKSVLISLRVLGMEVANLYITNDSVYATEKLHKYYIAEDVNSLRGEFPVSISDVQDMLLGQAFILERGRLKMSELEKYGTIIPNKICDDVEYAFCVSKEDKLTIFSVCRQGEIPLVSQYSNHVETAAGMIAEKTKINLSAGKTKLDATIMWDAESAKWNTGKPSAWKMPKGYKRISGEALLKTLGGL